MSNRGAVHVEEVVGALSDAMFVDARAPIEAETLFLGPNWALVADEGWWV